MHSVHPAFKLLDDTSLTRVHHFQTLGTPKFPAVIMPPLYPPESGVVQNIFYQPVPLGLSGRGQYQFSCIIIFTLEDWTMKERIGDNAALEYHLNWRRQVYPKDPEILRALESETQFGTPMKQMEAAIGMLSRAPLVRGFAIAFKFGHRGSEYPYIEPILDPGFGMEEILRDVDQKIHEYFAYEGRLGIRVLRTIQAILGFVLPKWQWLRNLLPLEIPQKPEQVHLLPDLWEGNADLDVIRSRCETIIASFIRRVEQRPEIAEKMARAGISPAPGDNHTVVLQGEAAERAITAKQIRRDGGITTYKPDEDLMLDMLIHSGTKPRIENNQKPQGIGRAADQIAPPPPPPKDFGGSFIPAQRPLSYDTPRIVVPSSPRQGDELVVEPHQQRVTPNLCHGRIVRPVSDPLSRERDSRPRISDGKITCLKSEEDED